MSVVGYGYGGFWLGAVMEVVDGNVMSKLHLGCGSVYSLIGN